MKFLEFTPSVTHKTKKKIALAFGAVTLLAINATSIAAPISSQGNWESKLIGIDLVPGTYGYEAVYDTELNITWLGDAGFAGRNGVFDNRAKWQDAVNWASQQIIYGTNGWRLPKLIDTGNPGCDYALSGSDCGYNPATTTSELAHLFYTSLGNHSFLNSNASTGVLNTGPFEGVRNNYYWLGQEYAPDKSQAWNFYFAEQQGLQYHYSKTNQLNIWLVHDGNIFGAAVPEPKSITLFLSGMFFLVAASRSRSCFTR